jgi:hypothetical protein
VPVRKRKIDAELEAALAERAEFVAGFRRSRRGNLWRSWQGATLTVFERRGGGYGWCVASDAGTEFAQDDADTEADALDALAYTLQVGYVQIKSA